MYIEELPESVISAMSDRQWQIAAWNAAVDGIATQKTRIISIRHGRWVVACTSPKDIATLTKNNDVLYNLRKIDSLRKLPYIRIICPVPDAVTSAQARSHRDLNDVFQSSGHTTAHPQIPVATIDMLRRLPIKSMPIHLWHELAWKLAAGPEIASTSQVRTVINGTWVIACDDAETQRAIESSLSIAPMLRWLARYREYEVKDIKTVTAGPRLATNQSKEYT